MIKARFIWCSVLLLLLLLTMPVTQAFDSEKVVILVLNPTKKISTDDIAALVAKLGSQFKFPKYELLKDAYAPPAIADQIALEKLSQASGADDVLMLDVKQFRSGLMSSLYGDETLEDTSVSLALHYFNKKSGQFGQLKGEKSTLKIWSIYSGPLPLSMEILDDMLNKLDPVFPRQFPGPRY